MEKKKEKMGDNHEKQKVVQLADITIYNGVREGDLQIKGKGQREEWERGSETPHDKCWSRDLTSVWR